VPWDTDAVHGDPGAASDLDVEEGHQNRKAFALLDHAIEHGINRSVVVFFGAAEAECVEDVQVDSGDLFDGAAALRYVESCGQVVEAVYKLTRIEPGLLVGSDECCTAVEGDRRGVHAAQAAQSGEVSVALFGGFVHPDRIPAIQEGFWWSAGLQLARS